MPIQRMDHVGLVVDDLETAIAFFVELGLELQGKGATQGSWVDRVLGLEAAHVEIAMLQTADGHARIELSKFHAPEAHSSGPPAPVNTLGFRHVAFVVDDLEQVVAGLRARGTPLVGELVRYEDTYKLCLVRGPEGIIVELAEEIG